ncbi:hypothetical protein NDU88_002500, partial [Pleurodeles waltl]
PQCQAGGRKHLLPKLIQPLGFPIWGSGREGTTGSRGLDNQALRSGVLCQETRVAGSASMATADCPIHRSPCAGFG